MESCLALLLSIRLDIFWLSVGSPISTDVHPWRGRGAKTKAVQNVNVSMSICQNATFQLRYQNESCLECHQDIRQSVCHYVNTSTCQNATFKLRYQNESFLGSQNLTRKQHDSQQIFCGNKSKKQCFDGIFEHISAVQQVYAYKSLCVEPRKSLL